MVAVTTELLPKLLKFKSIIWNAFGFGTWNIPSIYLLMKTCCNNKNKTRFNHDKIWSKINRNTINCSHVILFQRKDINKEIGSTTIKALSWKTASYRFTHPRNPLPSRSHIVRMHCKCIMFSICYFIDRYRSQMFEKFNKLHGNKDFNNKMRLLSSIDICRGNWIPNFETQWFKIRSATTKHQMHFLNVIWIRLKINKKSINYNYVL